MTGGSIVGCSAGGLGGGVHLAYDSSIGKSSTFTMTGGSIIGDVYKKQDTYMPVRHLHTIFYRSA